MTFNEAKDIFLNRGYVEVEGGQIFDGDKWRQCIVVISEWLKQQPCEDAISRQAVLEQTYSWCKDEFFRTTNPFDYLRKRINSLKTVTPQQKIGHCKDCKYFEYDSLAKVDGIPLIVAHEICNKWGDGCKSKEDGYCFLFEPKMEVKE